MEKNGFAEKVEWMKEGLSEMLMAAEDVDDQNCGSARKFIADMAAKMDEWMEAHYGDGK